MIPKNNKPKSEQIKPNTNDKTSHARLLCQSLWKDKLHYKKKLSQKNKVSSQDGKLKTIYWYWNTALIQHSKTKIFIYNNDIFCQGVYDSMKRGKFLKMLMKYKVFP